MEHLDPQVVQAALQGLGLFPAQAALAVGDGRIAWTEAALAACAEYIRRSTAQNPVAALWSQYLQHGTTPPALTVIPSPAPVVLCPVCKHDPHAPQPDAPDGCQGLHGWAAAFRIELHAQDGAA